MIAYTTLRVIDRGVVLHAWHARRLAVAGPEVAHSFEAFARTAEPGVYSLRAQEGVLQVEQRGGSRLFDGMPVRFAPSPLTGTTRIAKPAPPSAYESVREAGVATLLTSPDGRELYESCSAALIGWEAERYVCVPSGRPRVGSTAEAALREALPFTEAPLGRDAEAPLLLLNAVKGTCTVALPGRAPFPLRARERLDALLLSTASRG